MKCTNCFLQDKGRSNCMPGWGNEVANLQIWLDYPAEEADRRHKPRESKQARFIDWLLRRNSLSLQDIYVGYTLRCHVPKNVLKKKESKLECLEGCFPHQEQANHAKAIVALGEISALCFADVGRIGDLAGSYRTMLEPKKHRVYVDYAPGYAMASPAESVSISRTIWFAAEFCGLTPKIDPKELQNFDFEIF